MMNVMMHATRMLGTFGKTSFLKGILAAAALGALPVGARADHHDRDRDRPVVHIDLDLHRHAPPPVVVEERPMRVWVEPVCRTVTERQWVEPVYRTVVEHVVTPPVTGTVVDHVWVPDHYDTREVVRHVRHRDRVLHERVFVPGHYEDQTREVEVSPGHAEDVQRQELVSEGHWANVDHQEVVVPGHWETRTQQVEVTPPVHHDAHFDLRIPIRLPH